MSQTVLLTGAPGSGKTTLIRRVLDHLDRLAGGFYTQEIRTHGVRKGPGLRKGPGSRKGFEIVTLDGRRGTLAHVDIDGQPRVSRYGVDLDTLDRLAVGAIREATAAGGLVVIDEIGPMEILSERFQEAVLDAVQGPSPVLGTIVQRRQPFADRVKALPGVTLLQVRRENQEALLTHILKLLDVS